MSSENEAHWSVGGSRFSRLTLQGKIDNNVNKLRADRESGSPTAEARYCSGGSEKNSAVLVSPPPAPFATKRRRYMAFVNDNGEEVAEAEEIGADNRRSRRRLVKKLWDDFDMVARENEGADLSETGNEETIGKLTSYDDDATIMKADVDVNNSKYEGKKAKAPKNSKIQGNNKTVSGKNGARTSTILAKRDSN
ncbi:uncharacterized protein LOC129313247 [Prosopis cineraria]|uniref:uncharacterized protein LOC129313247 n=1 Tax=Prosopis cineraria TaxID=364024 RepID=UPI00240F5E7D|nr:uncharacterized protein LOC129313247 [Prosopis cineraria]